MISVLNVFFGEPDLCSRAADSSASGGSAPLRIALLPDYRSKTLFLASLLDTAV